MNHGVPNLKEFGTPVIFVPLTFFCAKIILINRTELITEETSLRAKAHKDGSREQFRNGGSDADIRGTQQYDH